MVKIPGLDDLKKMGSDLIDSAKTVNLGGMVDKFKSGMDAVSNKPVVAAGDDPLGRLIQDMSSALNELAAINATQAAAIKKLQNQLADIGRVAAVYQKPTPAPTTTTTEAPVEPEPPQEEDKK